MAKWEPINYKQQSGIVRTGNEPKGEFVSFAERNSCLQEQQGSLFRLIKRLMSGAIVWNNAKRILLPARKGFGAQNIQRKVLEV